MMNKKNLSRFKLQILKHNKSLHISPTVFLSQGKANINHQSGKMSSLPRSNHFRDQKLLQWPRFAKNQVSNRLLNQLFSLNFSLMMNKFLSISMRILNFKLLIKSLIIRRLIYKKF